MVFGSGGAIVSTSPDMQIQAYRSPAADILAFAIPVEIDDSDSV
jgi:hypothetical protein